MDKKTYGLVGYENAGKRFTRTTDREYYRKDKTAMFAWKNRVKPEWLK
jgi:hypothetical protein